MEMHPKIPWEMVTGAHFGIHCSNSLPVTCTFRSTVLIHYP